MTEERLMRYARAIARVDVDNWAGPGAELPDEGHEFWASWRAEAAAVMKVADEEYTTPAPGSTRAKLPDHLLALLPHRDYESTACELARDIAVLIEEPPQKVVQYLDEYRGWRDFLHKWCRLNNKFRGTRCICSCHTGEAG